MRKLILLVALTTTCAFTFAQSGPAFGIKGGLNYNANGDYFESIEQNVEDPGRNIGYHIGLFGKIGNRLYFRPELVYTRTKSDYTLLSEQCKDLNSQSSISHTKELIN